MSRKSNTYQNTNLSATETTEVKKIMKSSSKETKARRIINHIHHGATWEEASSKEGISVGYAHSIVKSLYKLETCYNNLLKKARANKKAQKEEKKILDDAKANTATDAETKSEVAKKEVSLVETGYIISLAGLGKTQEFLDNHKVIVIPAFCIGELKKLCNSYPEIGEVLDLYWDRKILSIDLRYRETLYVEPTYPVKNRTKGVVAAACELDSMGYDVKVYTNSTEIEALANLQEAKFEVERIKSVSVH